jgi:Ca-activated chloride channel family protein
MFLGMARPSVVLTLPSERAVVVLAIDVSGSMRAADVPPDRMTVAKDAARAFVAKQPRTTRVGLVAFSTSAMIVEEPTIVRDDVLTAIDNLRPQRFTAAGSGLVASLQAIFPDDPLDLSRLSSARSELQPAPLGEVKEEEPEFRPVPPGSNTSAVIVCSATGGPTSAWSRWMPRAWPLIVRACSWVRHGRGGTSTSAAAGCARSSTGHLMAIPRSRRQVLLQDRADLKSAYETLTTQFVAETKRTEVTAFGAALALVLLVLALGLCVANS